MAFDPVTNTSCFFTHFERKKKKLEYHSGLDVVTSEGDKSIKPQRGRRKTNKLRVSRTFEVNLLKYLLVVIIHISWMLILVMNSYD